MSDKQVDIDRDYLFQERRNSMQRTAQIEDLLEIPRSVVPKKLRKLWRKFLRDHGYQIDGAISPGNENDLDITEGGPN